MNKGTPQQTSSNESGSLSPTEVPSRRRQLFQALVAKLEGAKQLDGLGPAGTALLCAAYFELKGGPLLCVCPLNQGIDEIAENLGVFLPSEAREQVLVLPGSENDPYRGLSPHPAISRRRAEVLWQLSSGFEGILLTSVASLITRTLAPEEFRSRSLKLNLGDQIPRHELISKLRSMGYLREDPVSEVGEFSFRGGIVDFFSPSRPYPIRLDFFGDEIDSIREFDPSTQRSVGLTDRCEIVPIRDLIVRESEIDQWHTAAPEYWNEVRYGTALSEILQFTEHRELFNGFEYLFPLVVPTDSSLFDYLPDQSVTIFVSEPDEVQKELVRRIEQADRGYEDCSLEGILALPPKKLLWNRREIERFLQRHRVIDVERLSEAEEAEHFDLRPERRYDNHIKNLLDDLQKWRADGEHVAFVMSTEGMAERLVEIFREYDVLLPKVTPDRMLDEPCSVTKGHISSGFHSPSMAFHLLSQDNVFGEAKIKRAGLRPPVSDAAGVFLSDFRDLHEGDYVVHVDHGIGRFRGLKEIGVGAETAEFVILEYQGASKLYLPVDRLDLLQKYSSSGATTPPIDRLGGTSWTKTKARIKKSMQVLAEDLLKLYAKRELAQGHGFAPDDELMREFEEAFEYIETKDQMAAINATKRDMESNRPMDRLICGDVGYGKTEVAMRATFKAVSDGKQVAILAPTTVLAFQHLNTFTERFKGFPIKIEMLSRFRSRAEQKEVIQQVRQGLVDVLIGTHRILSKDVSFANLGLIVVDEEQRFGVAQKEKLKKLKAQVDVLTLSATPIPRTLNMSLAGIRDLSIIETAPKDRLAIQTAVLRFTKNVIRSAIDLELKRNGQVFFVHNSIETLFSMAQMIQSLLPEARVCAAHGQMNEELLEEVMLDFLKYRYDVLVCTTIIENGLDIPRANTIIINNADRFGLSQLYQLRGRVGRSNRRAYAYLLTSPEDVLSTEARKRLAAIREFSDLGSGFRLAAMDLEIRGAGNLLGGEQSGHISAVGFELYVKLLDQAVRELRGETLEDEIRCNIDLRVDIQIPDHYIDDSNVRLWLYKRISNATQASALDSLKEEIGDRFGQFPRSVANLLEYARLRLRAQRLKIQSIDRKGQQVQLKFNPKTPVAPEMVISLVSSNGDLSFTADGNLQVTAPSTIPSEIFPRLHEVIERLSV